MPRSALDRPVAVVTGASSGIGQAVAVRFAAAGYRTYGLSRRGGPAPAGGAAVRVDVTDGDAVTQAVRAIEGERGRIDVLVNAAGFALLGALEECSVADARAIFDTNLFGAIRMTSAVLPGMRAARKGRVVSISSIVGFLPAAYMGLYAATKHALEAYAETLDHEVRGFGIRSVLVEPSFTRTNIVGATRPASGPLDAYAGVRRAFEMRLEAAFATAIVPDTVAAVTLAAAQADRPRLRYPVGPGAGVLRRLRQWLPERAFDRAYRRQFGLDTR